MDYPSTDNENWLKEIIVKRVNDKENKTLRPIVVTKLSPPKEVCPYLDMMKKMMNAHSEIGGHH